MGVLPPPPFPPLRGVFTLLAIWGVGCQLGCVADARLDLVFVGGFLVVLRRCPSDGLGLRW